MELPSQCVLLRIFFGEDDRAADGKPLHEAIVIKAREIRVGPVELKLTSFNPNVTRP